MTTKTKAAVLAVGLPLVIAAGLVVFFVTRSLVIPKSTPMAAATTVSSAAPEISSIPCGEVATTDAVGNPVGAIASLAGDIHDAACRRDYSGLARYMEESFGGFPKKVVVAGWQRQRDDDTVLRELVRALETRAFGDQGGYLFCSPNGAVVIIARGTIDHPGGWSDYDPTGHRLVGMCEVAR